MLWLYRPFLKLTDVDKQRYDEYTDRAKEARKQAQADYPYVTEDHSERLVDYLVAYFRYLVKTGTLSLSLSLSEHQIVTEFSDRRFFTDKEASMLSILQESYGEALHVETIVWTDSASDSRFEYTAHVFHPDFRPTSRWGVKLKLHSTYSGSTRLEHFCLHGPGIEPFLLERLRLYVVNNPNIDNLIEDFIGSSVVDSEGKLHIPTWPTTRSERPNHRLTRCPSFGQGVFFDAEMLCTEGVVVNLKGLGRFRVWFNYELYFDEDGYIQTVPMGEHTLVMQPTEDRVTTSKLKKYGNFMRGKPSSAQAMGIVPYKGNLPYCLFCVNISGSEYRINVMVDVNENNEIVRAWMEGSS